MKYQIIEKLSRVKRRIFFLGGQAWQMGVVERGNSEDNDAVLVKWEDGQLKEMLPEQLEFQ